MKDTPRTDSLSHDQQKAEPSPCLACGLSFSVDGILCPVCLDEVPASQEMAYGEVISALKARIAVLERQRDEYGEWLQAAYDDNGCDCLSLYFALNVFETVFPEIAEETPNG